MATIEVTPTPPVKRLGPIVRVPLYFPDGNDSWKLTAGNWEGIPQIWEILFLWVQLAASADVANRVLNARAYLDIGNATDYLWYIKTPNITASQTKKLAIGQWALWDGSASNGADFAANYNRPPIISGDNVLQVYPSNGEAADVITGNVWLKYMNREYGMPTPYDD